MKEDKVIAFFDFDGTITDRDIFWDYLLFRLRSGLSPLKVVKCFPDFALYLAKVLNNEQAKQRIFGKLFKGESVAFFNNMVDQYYATKLFSRIKKDALDRINWHKKSNHTVCIVSANFDLILSKLAQQYDLELLCTQLDIKDEILTGRFKTANCYGLEKVNRIKQRFLNIEFYSQIYAYGDSKGDREMLALSTHPFYCFFKK